VVKRLGRHSLGLGLLVTALMLTSWVAQAETTVGVCTLPLTIRATMVAEGEPTWSLATIYNTQTKHTGTYSIKRGHNVMMAGAVLVGIESLAVTVRTKMGVQRCWAEGHAMSDPAAAGKKPGSATNKPASKEPTHPQIKKLLGELTKLRFDDYRGPLSTEIPGVWRENNRGIRSNDFKREGTGFQVVKLDQDTLVYQLGLRNFDIVKRINGQPIDDPRKAIHLLEGLGGIAQLRVEVQRQGRPMTLDVDY